MGYGAQNAGGKSKTVTAGDRFQYLPVPLRERRFR
jgi:hypothetical protein